MTMKTIPCRTHTHEGPYDPLCKRPAEDIPSVVAFAKDNGLTPAEFVRQEKGTYNPQTRHFLCDECFIAEENRRGARLVGANGTPWRCP